MKNKIIGCILGAMVCIGCSNRIAYCSFQDMSTEGWHKDSVCRFDYTIEDTSAEYEIILYIRHSEVYPYQNMWLFVEQEGKRDTIEFYLANDRGVWLGNGKNGIVEMPVLYEEKWHYTDSIHSIAIQHGMREEELKGIVSVGVEVVKKKQE